VKQGTGYMLVSVVFYQLDSLDYWTTYESILIKFCSDVVNGLRGECLDFDGNSDFLLCILDSLLFGDSGRSVKSFVFARRQGHHCSRRRFEISDRFYSFIRNPTALWGWHVQYSCNEITGNGRCRIRFILLLQKKLHCSYNIVLFD